MELAQLMGGSDSSENPEGPQLKPTRAIKDLASWLQAHARLIVTLLSDAATSKEEAVGLASHLHVVLQVAQDEAGADIMPRIL